jgi:hypothetical protein
LLWAPPITTGVAKKSPQPTVVGVAQQKNLLKKSAFKRKAIGSADFFDIRFRYSKTTDVIKNKVLNLSLFLKLVASCFLSDFVLLLK